MQTFTVHEPSDGPADRIERAESLVFIKDGFSLAAALLTPFWLIANRLWLALVAYLAAVGLIELVVWALGIDQAAAAWPIFALHLLIGLESDALRCWGLGRRGYTLIGSVSGRNWDECERRFLDSWLKEQPFVAPRALAQQGAESGRGTGGRLSATALWPGRA